jgi:plasmid maintenance system antidote protein VapI
MLKRGFEIRPLFISSQYLKIHMHSLERLPLISPPGDTIKETIEYKIIHDNYSIGKFILSVGNSRRMYDLLLEGKIRITEPIAQKLEKELGIQAEFWLNRQERYEENIASLFFSDEQEKKAFKKGMYFFAEYLNK